MTWTHQMIMLVWMTAQSLSGKMKRVTHQKKKWGTAQIILIRTALANCPFWLRWLTLPPLCFHHLPMPWPQCNMVYLMKREESPPAIWINLHTHPLALTVTIFDARAPCPPQSVEEQLAASEKRNEEFQHEVERLKAHCVLSGVIITCLQKKVNMKETKKKSSACAKKTTGEARVLTSKEGHQELQQLCEKSWQKEMHQNAELAWKAAEGQAWREHRADPTHTFTGPLNKSQCKEDLTDIAAALLLLNSGKKDDIFKWIIKEFNGCLELKPNPHFEGLFHSHPQKQACVDDGTGPSNLTGTPSLSATGPTSPSNSSMPGPSSFTY